MFTAKALAGNEQAREELRDAYTSARKAYKRSADRSGRPNIVTLLDDRKAKKEAGNALTSLRHALRIADKKRRKKPRGGKGPAVLVLTAAGAGAGALIYKQRSAKRGDRGHRTNGRRRRLSSASRTADAGLSKRRPRKRGWRRRPWRVHSVKPTSATSSGSTHVAPATPVSRSANGEASRSSGVSRSPSSSSVAWSKPVPTLPA